MGRLEDACIRTLVWQEYEDEGIVTAEGMMTYEIDDKNEIAIFQDDKCVEVKEAKDFAHAASMVWAHEHVCSYNAARGHDHRGKPVNKRGWRV